MPTTQQNRNDAGTGNRGKPHRQGNASVPLRLPPISVSAMGNSDRRRQQAPAGDTARHGSNGFTAVRGAGINAAPGHVYKCSASACVTVLPPENTQNPSTNGGDELSNGSADFSNRNRKHCSSTTTRMNGDRLPLVVTDNKNLTSHVSIVDGDSLRIVVDGLQVLLCSLSHLFSVSVIISYRYLPTFSYSYKPNTHRRRRHDSTVELSRVGGLNAPVGSRDPVHNFLCC